MTTESPTIDICYLEAWLEHSISSYSRSGNQQLLAKICLAINVIIQHDDFVQIVDHHCSYYKMKNYWLWRYQMS